MQRFGRRLGLALFTAAALAVASQAGPARATQNNDYPTVARADYVFACMAGNGQTQDMLRRCSCSIDVIAGIVPYKRYVEAETILRMRQMTGEKSVTFRDSSEYKAIVADLKGAQAEAEIRCF